MRSLYTKIYSDLIKHENKKAAEIDKKYHKYDGHRSLGIKAGELDKLLKQYKTEVKNLSCKEAFVLAQMLYKDKIEDTILAGNFVLQNKIYCIGKSELPLLDKALDSFKHFRLPTDFPKILPIPRELACKYSPQANGPPDDGCQLEPGTDLYEAIDAPAPAD